MYLFVAAITVAFAACSGGKKAETPEESVAIEVETIESAVVDSAAALVDSLGNAVATVPQVENPAEALKAFEAFAKEYAEAFNNLAKDPAKFQKLGQELQGKVADMERLKEKFDKKQTEAYTKAVELITKVNKGGK
jgi:DNA repair ATPase RecN